MEAVTVSPKYQIVIPKMVRERWGIKPGQKMMVVEFDGSLRLVPVRPISELRGIARGMDPTIVREPDRKL